MYVCAYVYTHTYVYPYNVIIQQSMYSKLYYSMCICVYIYIYILCRCVPIIHIYANIIIYTHIGYVVCIIYIYAIHLDICAHGLHEHCRRLNPELLVCSMLYHMCIYVFTHICYAQCVYIYTCYTYIYIYIYYVYLYIHRERDTDR